MVILQFERTVFVMSDHPRMRRSQEDRIAALDQKIIFHKEKIELLEAHKKAILNPKQKKKSKTDALNEIYKAAKASGKTLDDVLELLKP